MSEYSEKIKAIQEIKKIQEINGNWDTSDYMRGLHNGIEISLAILENRDPDLKG